jgi:cytochrome c peroxidase
MGYSRHMRRGALGGGGVLAGGAPAACVLAMCLLAGCEKVAPPPARLAAVTAPEIADEPLQPLPAAPPPVDARHAALGATLFADKRLSHDGTVACASCHPLDRAGADGEAHSITADAGRTAMNTPTVFNAVYSFRFNWTGLFDSLEAELDAPLAKAMHSDWPTLERTVRDDAAYRRAFAAAFPDGVTVANIKEALVAFERTLVTPDAPFDRFLRGDGNALDAEAREGYRLFKEYGCSSCHQGANVGGNMLQRFGLFGGARDPRLFRVPSLRNIARTAPYFHDGSAATLEEAIATMAQAQLGRQLPGAAVSRIAAFLDSLSGRYRGQPL